ncbi:hypothetical protein Y1Q_0015819 [Alligator mississippiensis]|uniref:Secreted protein n=1 Tax=Alligator mississippiensis TaxID=8496 RepID=A0A151MH24_ALLMI|nr:hypothetical protein Y1Q_0015819 [Alligator mississippiensis]
MVELLRKRQRRGHLQVLTILPLLTVSLLDHNSQGEVNKKKERVGRRRTASGSSDPEQDGIFIRERLPKKKWKGDAMGTRGGVKKGNRHL